MAGTMTTIMDCSLPAAVCALFEVDCPTAFYISVFAFIIIPLCTVLYLTTHRHRSSIEGFEDYQCEQNILLATLLLLEVYNFANLALFEPMLALCMLPVISADIFMMALVCSCMLLHHMMFEPFPRQLFLVRLLLPEDIFEELQCDSSEQTDDGEEPEWESDCTTVCGDEMEYEQTDYGGETEPLLREWMAEQPLLSDSISQIGDDDDGDDDDSSFSTSSTVNNEFITQWSGSSDSDYDSDSSISLNISYSGD